MPSYRISLIAVPAQTFSAQLGANVFLFKLQWQQRYGYFRMDIRRSNNELLTAGRPLHIGVDMFSGLYPGSTTEGFGTLVMSGDAPTPDNLGIDNQLVWSNV